MYPHLALSMLVACHSRHCWCSWSWYASFHVFLRYKIAAAQAWVLQLGREFWGQTAHMHLQLFA